MIAIPEFWKGAILFIELAALLLMCVKNVDLVNRNDKLSEENIDLKKRLGRA